MLVILGVFSKLNSMVLSVDMFHTLKACFPLESRG